MRSAIQLLTKPRMYDYLVVSGDLRHQLIGQEAIWPRAVHRVVTEGISPEQAVDDALARIKEILSE
jgi:hypothetical protein